VRSVYIFGTVEGRDDGLAEERFDDRLDSTLSLSPELLVKTNRDNCRAVEDGAQLSKEGAAHNRSNPHLFRVIHKSDSRSMWVNETLEHGGRQG
jgi:hypothetical protein